MSWHYQVRKQEIGGEAFYNLIEMYENPAGWTTEESYPEGQTRDELIRDIENMLHDAKTYEVFEDLDEPNR